MDKNFLEKVNSKQMHKKLQLTNKMGFFLHGSCNVFFLCTDLVMGHETTKI